MNKPLSVLQHSLWLIAVLLLLSACAKTDLQDLEAFVAEKKAEKNIALPNLPEFPPEPVVLYTGKDHPDPFKSFEKSKIKRSSDLNLLGDEDEKPECRPPVRHNQLRPLEKFPLDALVLVGSYQEEGEIWGLVLDPGQKLHQVQVNEMIGENFGKIIDISATSLEIIELIEDNNGCFEEQQRTLKVKRK
ncbi:pilus assembly protein PilP [Candidatus Venteria ishoeyi]|uniref:pilus assembly protein PilP n=1 Tax=Candidatus Venteria ishoeyi TaxID=1899563 RepID=UPI0025A4EAEB|nr:pilus assembly protein PilP [Candidatus Venteria ishoeyi]MDM8547840.1 pilus assembly protein PilP [Candidatus Venteria ishoeyi]